MRKTSLLTILMRPPLPLFSQLKRFLQCSYCMWDAEKDMFREIRDTKGASDLKGTLSGLAWVTKWCWASEFVLKEDMRRAGTFDWESDVGPGQRRILDGDLSGGPFGEWFALRAAINRITVDYVGRGWTRDPTVGEGDVAFQLTEGSYISTVAVRSCGIMMGFDMVRMMVKMTQTLRLGKGLQSLLRGFGTIDMDDGDSRDGLGFTATCWEDDGTGVTILTQAGLGRDVVRAISDMSKEEKESFLKLYGEFGALLEVFCLNSGESRGTQPRRATRTDADEGPRGLRFWGGSKSRDGVSCLGGIEMEKQKGKKVFRDCILVLHPTAVVGMLFWVGLRSYVIDGLDGVGGDK